jgi:hypothetical protein
VATPRMGSGGEGRSLESAGDWACVRRDAQSVAHSRLAQFAKLRGQTQAKRRAEVEVKEKGNEFGGRERVGGDAGRWRASARAAKPKYQMARRTISKQDAEASVTIKIPLLA